jgi:hypothetical protein
MAENFGDADDRQVFGIDDNVASGSVHTLAAYAEERERTCRICHPLQGFDQLRAIHFTGRFSRRNQDQHADIVRDGLVATEFAVGVFLLAVALIGQITR